MQDCLCKDDQLTDVHHSKLILYKSIIAPASLFEVKYVVLVNKKASVRMHMQPVDPSRSLLA